MTNKRKRLGQAPSKEQQQLAEAQHRKKEFIKTMIKSPRLVIFPGGGQVSHWGFPANGDFLLFLLQEVYGWDGTNETFQRILANLQGRQQAVPSPEDQELDSLMAEVDQEGGKVNGDELQDDGGEGHQEENEAGEGQSEVPTPSNVVPMTPVPSVPEGTNTDEEAIARSLNFAKLAKLKAEMAALEAMTK